MWFELLQQDIAWNLEQTIRHEEDCKRGIVLVAFLQVKLLAQAVDVGVADIDSVQERKYYEILELLRLCQRLST